LDAVKSDLKNVHPGVVGVKVPEQASSRTGEESLIGGLQIVKVNGFLSVAPVDMAKDVQPGLDAPQLTKEVDIS
jgi:hypothetical protein